MSGRGARSSGRSRSPAEPEPGPQAGLISVCLPTFNRPGLLLQAVGSCLAQRHRPLELLVGDDSLMPEAAGPLDRLSLPDGVALHYRHNRPQLGQAANINRLFARARGDRLMLLHDDDRLRPGGLDRLVRAWADHPDTACAYGRQVLVDAEGAALPAETAAWDERYFRLAARVGPQASPLVAAIRQQVPNDGFLIEAGLARATGYRSERVIGQCVDADFMIRAAAGAPPGTFLFVDDAVSDYRLTPASIARATDLNRRQDLFFDSVDAIDGGPDEQEAKAVLLARISVGASLDAAMAGRRRAALRILLSRHYELPLFSRWTLYRLACIVSPRGGMRVKAWIQGGRMPARLRQTTLVAPDAPAPSDSRA